MSDALAIRPAPGWRWLAERAAQAMTWGCGVVGDAQFQPSSATSQPAWKAIVHGRLSELSILQENWDGRGSAKPSLDVLHYTATLLAEVMKPGIRVPSIVPLGSGAVQLVWSNDISELEVEVIRPNEMIALYVNLASGDESEWEEDQSLVRLPALVATMQA